MKKCPKCKQEKPLEAFSKDKHHKDGRAGHCKECQNSYNKAAWPKYRAKCISRMQKWAKENPALRRAYTQTHDAKRRAREAGLTKHFTVKEWLALCEKYGNKCLCCGATDKPLTVDHVLPMRYGGTNIIDNLQPLCLSCNSSKGEKIIDYRSKN